MCADDIGLEYAGAIGFRGLFACRQSLRPRHLRMLAEVARFHRAALRVYVTTPLKTPQKTTSRALDQFLQRHRFTRTSSTTSSRPW